MATTKRKASAPTRYKKPTTPAERRAYRSGYLAGYMRARQAAEAAATTK